MFVRLFLFGLLFLLMGALSPRESLSLEAEGIRWMRLEEAITASQKEPRKIYIDLYTDWCGWCKVMDRQTFTHREVIAHMKANYYAVKLNAEQREDIVFQGKTFRYVPTPQGGYQEFAAYLTQGELSYPMSIFLDEDLKLLTRVPGFQSPEKMAKILTFFGEEHYKSTSWEAYSNL